MSTPTATALSTTATTTASSTLLTLNSTTAAPSSTPSVFTYTYALPPITRIDGLDSFDIGARLMELISSGSDGERIVRGFLMGIAFGVILGGVLCCWVPCFGAKQRARRARRREIRAAVNPGTAVSASVQPQDNSLWQRVRRRA